MLSISLRSAAVVLLLGSALSESPSDELPYSINSVQSTRLAESNFWHPRLETNRSVTVWHNLRKCEETGRSGNFRKAAGLEEGSYQGLRFDDSDLYKVLEGASRVLTDGPDEKLEQALDELIVAVAKAQQPDGYIYTVMQVPHPLGKPVKGVVPGERWIHERESHETYCMGHLIEAGIAHYQATGKRALLDVAIRAADRLVADFGPGQMELPAGHQEVELALARLSQVTGNQSYLKLASWFLEQRGRLSDDRQRLWSTYFQDHVPVREQREAVGHAVRAAYQYAAMADVAVLTDDEQYREVLRALWENVASRKLYITGGIGGGAGEGFSGEYDLPNLRAYNETCSSIANILWQQRMFQLEGHAKYVDILERCLYNSFLSGISMEGDTFFYPNKLASVSGQNRSPWFRCACCPPNVLRFIPQIPSLFYASREGMIYVNLYGSSTAELKLDSTNVRLDQTSNYPWDGDVEIEIQPEQAAQFKIALRLPGWLNAPFPSDLYSYVSSEEQKPIRALITVNGETLAPEIEKGYAIVERQWQPGDVIRLELPMPVRRVAAHQAVTSCRDRVALMRGPIIYAVEAGDNSGNVHNLMVPANASFEPEQRLELLGGVVVLKGEVDTVAEAIDGELEIVKHELTAIPYYAWAHRGKQAMRVWHAMKPEVAWPTRLERAYTRASVTTSGHNPWTSPQAVKDQIIPSHSSDNETPRFLWNQNDHQPMGAGALEVSEEKQKLQERKHWIQYEFAAPETIRRTAVFWVTNPNGNWAVPKSFRFSYREGEEWKELPGKVPVPAADALQEVTFAPVETSAIRLEVVPNENKAVGLMEWIVE